MATTLDLLNNVLRGLRKDTLDSGATTTSGAYHLMAVQILNIAKRQIEAAWDWQALRTTVTVTLAQGTAEYTLTQAAAADADVGPLSRLLYENPTMDGSYESSTRVNGARPQVFDTTDSSEYRLREVPWETMERLHFTDDDQQDKPTMFALRRSGSGVLLKVYPTPSAARTLKMRFVIPQADLAADDLDETLTIPADEAVWLKALLIANEERGEELSRPNNLVAGDYWTSLHDAIARERTDAEDTSYPE